MPHIALFPILGVLLGVGGWQVVVWLGETRHKFRKYRAAVACARKAGKPLLVAGGPWGTKGIRQRLRIPAHGNGDVCLDVDPSAFQGHPCGVIGDVTQIPFADKSFGAAFASHLVEHLPTTSHARGALAELNRVAEAVFVVYPSRQSIAASAKREHHLWVWQKGKVTYIEQRGNSEGKKREEYP